MANQSLSQALSKTQSGQLYKAPDLSQLTTAAGLPAAPLTPQAGAGLGANPDQAKMMGSSAQKANALREAIQGQQGTDLATVQRQQQAAAASTAQKQEMAKAAGFQGLSSLQARVGELKDAAIQAAQNTALGTVQQQATNNQPLQAALTTLLAHPEDMTALAAANNALGRDATNMLDANTIVNTYANKAGTIAGTGFQNPTVGTFSPQQLKSLGYNSLDEIAAVTGQPVDQLKNMTLTQFQDVLQAELTKEFSTVEQLKARLADPTLGNAERQQIQEQLEQLGAAGVRATEANVDALQQDIADAATVSFRGQEMSVEEALGQEQVNSFVTDYVNGTPAEQAALDKQEPAMSLFVKKHLDLFKDLTNQISQTAGKLGAQVAANASVGDLGDGAKIDDKVMEALIPGFKNITGTAVTLPPLLDSIKKSNIDASQKQAVTSLLTNTQKSPAVLKMMSNTSITDLQKLGLTTPDSIVKFQSETLPRIQNYLDFKASPTAEPASVTKMLGFDSPASFAEKYHEAVLLNQSGLFGKNAAVEKLQKIIGNKIGPDTYQKIADAVKNDNLDISSLSGMIGSANGLAATSSDVNKYANPTGGNLKAYSFLHDLAINKSYDTKTIQAMSKDDITSLMDMPGFGRLLPGQQAAVKQEFTKKLQGEVVDPMLGPLSNNDFQHMNDAVVAAHGPLKTVDDMGKHLKVQATLDKTLTRLQDQLKTTEKPVEKEAIQQTIAELQQQRQESQNLVTNQNKQTAAAINTALFSAGVKNVNDLNWSNLGAYEGKKALGIKALVELNKKKQEAEKGGNTLFATAVQKTIDETQSKLDKLTVARKNIDYRDRVAALEKQQYDVNHPVLAAKDAVVRTVTEKANTTLDAIKAPGIKLAKALGWKG